MASHHEHSQRVHQLAIEALEAYEERAIVRCDWCLNEVYTDTAAFVKYKGLFVPMCRGCVRRSRIGTATRH